MQIKLTGDLSYLIETVSSTACVDTIIADESDFTQGKQPKYANAHMFKLNFFFLFLSLLHANQSSKLVCAQPSVGALAINNNSI